MNYDCLLICVFLIYVTVIAYDFDVTVENSFREAQEHALIRLRILPFRLWSVTFRYDSCHLFFYALKVQLSPLGIVKGQRPSHWFSLSYTTLRYTTFNNTTQLQIPKSSLKCLTGVMLSSIGIKDR